MLARLRSLGGYCTLVREPESTSPEVQLSDPLVAPFMIMGRVTYVHHYVSLYTKSSLILDSKSLQLPTRYFAVLMFAHLLDHFVFTAKRLQERTKWIVFYVFVASLVLMFWWFKGFAFGIDGPINNQWGLKWRKVRYTQYLFVEIIGTHSFFFSCRVGIYTMSNIDSVPLVCCLYIWMSMSISVYFFGRFPNDPSYHTLFVRYNAVVTGCAYENKEKSTLER